MHKQRGVTMIEILVTVAILSVGLLGLAAMQLIGIKNVNNTQFRTQATIMAYDIIERMRSNRAGVAAGAYDAVTGAETNPGCTVCSAAEMAKRDAYQWAQTIEDDIAKGGLPQDAVGTVTRNGNQFDVTITWPEQSRDATGGIVNDISLTQSVRL